MTPVLIYRPADPAIPRPALREHVGQAPELLADEDALVAHCGFRAVRFADGIRELVHVDDLVVVNPAPVVLVLPGDRLNGLLLYRARVFELEFQRYLRRVGKAAAEVATAIGTALVPALGSVHLALQRVVVAWAPLIAEDNRARRSAMHAAYRRRRR